MIDHYDLDNDLVFLANSEIRLKILSELQRKPNSIKELVENTNITYSSVSSNLTKLEEHNHITKKKNKFYLNPLSEIYYNNLMEFKLSIDLINDFNDLWNQHNIDQLSLDSIQNITDLKNSKLVETTPLDIYKTHNTLKDNMTNTKNIKAIFPYLDPEYPQLIENILRNNGSAELIIPKNMFKRMVFEIDDEIRKSAARKGNLKVYTTQDDLKLYLALCDSTMSLGLFKNDESFDQNRILISSSKQSRKWANDLFTGIKEKM